ncbi:MAG: DNA repair protein RecO [Prevotella sp.]|jgi:DNA repair protein RecO (recombination protein O)|nr:DNA repair protein RecO [Prevotella sp.]
MLTKTEAIVLHSIKYGESKMIVDMFTRQHGRLSFVIGLPKSAHARLKKQYFQPLTILNIECDVRPQLSLQKLSDASIHTPLPSLLSTPVKLAISLFLSEFLYHALRDEQQNILLFDYITSSLEWLESRDSDYANFHLVFLMHLSRFLGFYPNLEERGVRRDERGVRKEERTRSEEAYFDLQAASFCSAPPLHRDFLMPQEASMLRLMMRMDFPNMHLFHMNRQQRNRCIEVALQFYRIHLPDFPELRSLDVLKELWN